MNSYENPHIREPSPIVVESAVLRVITSSGLSMRAFRFWRGQFRLIVGLRHHSLSLMSPCKAVRPWLRYHERLESESFYTSPFSAVVIVSSIFYGSRFYQHREWKL